MLQCLRKVEITPEGCLEKNGERPRDLNAPRFGLLTAGSAVDQKNIGVHLKGNANCFPFPGPELGSKTLIDM